MPTDPIRTWTIRVHSKSVAGRSKCRPECMMLESPALHSVRVADAAAVAAALDQLAEAIYARRLTPFQLLVEVNRLREAVSGE